MLQLTTDGREIAIADAERVLTPAQKSMLALWRFSLLSPDRLAMTVNSSCSAVLAKIVDYFENEGLGYELDEFAVGELQRYERALGSLQHSRESGRKIKEEGYEPGILNPFLSFCRDTLPRRLRGHQVQAAKFMLSVVNSANFSVPGSGKSSVVLAVFAWLRHLNECRSLFVVGPRSCFVPWQHEYNETIGTPPRVCVLAGVSVHNRRSLYYPGSNGIADLYLSTYQTLMNDITHVRELFCHPSNSVFFVIDEAHYVKRAEGAWAQAVQSASKGASRCCILTGTPFPHSYADAISLFEVSYPEVSPFTADTADRIRVLSERGYHDQARRILEPVIEPLYYRVRKQDLGLSEPVFVPPIAVAMNPIERHLYETIANRIRSLSESDARRDAVTVSKLRRGRLIRLRQVLSNSALLSTVIDEYDEELLGNDDSLASLIANYQYEEIPAKVTALLNLVASLRARNEKVVVWSYFVNTLSLLRQQCSARQWQSEIVCGSTPTNPGTTGKTRDTIIERFKEAGSGLDILIANPSACAESISLHRTCSHAIYYDLSYNCAEYLQSLDRIHRVGGSETKDAYYHYLQYADTREPEILRNISEKARRMAIVLDTDLPYSSRALNDVEESIYQLVAK